MDTPKYRTIKILSKTYPNLRLLAAVTGENMSELLDRLIAEKLDTLEPYLNAGKLHELLNTDD